MNTLLKYINDSILDIEKDRQRTLWPLLDYIQDQLDLGLVPQLNFICTHNSRRSQLAQVWMQTLANFKGFNIHCFSGGVEVTACANQTIHVLRKCGFTIDQMSAGSNPIYLIQNNDLQISLFSKLFDDKINPTQNFAAVMTCDHAEANCPFVPGASKRIAVTYEDPKLFDGTKEEELQYERRCTQMASEMKWVVDNLKKR